MAHHPTARWRWARETGPASPGRPPRTAWNWLGTKPVHQLVELLFLVRQIAGHGTPLTWVNNPLMHRPFEIQIIRLALTHMFVLR
jgi:hypothetical protein